MKAASVVLCAFLSIGLIPHGLIARKTPGHSPKIENSFDASSGDAAASYRDHPDLAMAACSGCGTNGQVMVATGMDVTIYNLSGAVLKTQRIIDFMTNAGVTPGRINDPRGAYDPFIERWILVCSCAADFLLVSGSKDATGPWKGIAVSEASGDLTMFPGFDKNGVYISEYQPKLSSRVIALPGADVAWTGGGNISLAHEAIFADRPYEMRPAIDPNPKKKPTDPEYLIARTGPPQNATNFPMELLVDRTTWSGGKATIDGQVTIPTGFLYNTPIAASQPAGPAIRGAESHRVFGVAAHNGHLYLVGSSGPCKSDCGAQGADSNNLFYWFDVSTRTMTLTQKAKIADPSLSFLFPTIATDGRGNVGIGVTGISRSQHPSVYLLTHLADDPLGKMNGPFLAYAGTEGYSCGKNPAQTGVVGWGTYSATVRDASDPMKLWTVHQYAGSPTPCVWKTRVIGFRLAPGSASKSGNPGGSGREIPLAGNWAMGRGRDGHFTRSSVAFPFCPQGRHPRTCFRSSMPSPLMPLAYASITASWPPTQN